MPLFQFFSLFQLWWCLFFFLPFAIKGASARASISVGLPVLYLLAMFASGNSMLPWQRLVVSTAGLLYALKSALLFKLPCKELSEYSKIGLLLFMSVWPGFDLDAFAAKCERSETDSAAENEVARQFVRGYTRFGAGLILSLVVAFYAADVPKVFLGYLGIAALLLIIHFGYAEMLAAVLRLSGWAVTPLFKDPFASTSLNDFWSHRWNLAFVEMDRRLFVPVLRTRLTKVQTFFAVFVVSGVLHELAVSFSCGSGWGGPLLYFIVQAAGVLIERKVKPRALVGKVWTYTWLFLPLPLLFQHAFRGVFIVPPYMALHSELMTLSLPGLISLALWCAGVGHFCTLGAGLQVPFRLKWKEELARLSPFNAKIFLNYAAYVGLTIIAFGVMTLVEHDELMRGGKEARCLTAFITIFWSVRLLVDRFYFKDDEWPQGPLIIIGHAFLNTLFVCLTGTYAVLLLWQTVLH